MSSSSKFPKSRTQICTRISLVHYTHFQHMMYPLLLWEPDSGVCVKQFLSNPTVLVETRMFYRFPMISWRKKPNSKYKKLNLDRCFPSWQWRNTIPSSWRWQSAFSSIFVQHRFGGNSLAVRAFSAAAIDSRRSFLRLGCSVWIHAGIVRYTRDYQASRWYCQKITSNTQKRSQSSACNDLNIQKNVN